MNELEVQLKDMILNRYGSLSNFCKTINMPWATLDSILKRGISNANISNVLKISHELGIDTESLASGKIVPASTVDTLAAHFEGDGFTPEEMEEIKKYADFVRSRREE